MRWCIYYGDGTTYSDKDGDAFNAPPRNAIVLAQEREEGGARVMHSKDAFVLRDGRWYGVDEMGLWDYMMDTTGPLKVLFGRWVHDKVFDDTYQRARKEWLK